METTDANGNVLKNGDSVLFTKSIKIKGTQIHLKKGTKIKNIRLTDDPEEIDGKVEGTRIVLKTCFVKKK
ncbi:MAG: alkylphosphonate utilization protein [Flavobacteriales bacterium]|jgi:protein PhnA|nr:alkylphosphonate utilization protein [Flavobacteriales bacterium]